MPKPISHRELIRKLRNLGFVGPFAGGRHQYMKRGNFRLAIPNPHRQDIASGLLSKIIREIRISSEEFELL
ncbi:MAG: type II toxin-antitoxin system HicA family toxin [Patescibacteria group bacterium]